jgi:hypothetical protein
VEEKPSNGAPAGRQPPTEPAEVDLQLYFSVLKEVLEQIRASDRKAGFLTAANALLVGFLAREVEHLTSAQGQAGAGGLGTWALIVFATVAGVGALLSVSLLTRAFTISFGKLATLSRVYFGRISQDYKEDPAKYVRDTRRMGDEEWAGELAAFIVEASVVAARKDRLLTAAAWATLIGFSAWTLVLIAFWLPAGPR